MNRSIITLLAIGWGAFNLSSCAGKDTTENVEPTAPTAESQEIEAAIAAQVTELTACYEKSRNGNAPMPTGNVIAKFSVLPAGKVSEAKIQESSLKSPKTEECILALIKNTKFPKQKNETDVTYPFRFSAE